MMDRNTKIYTIIPGIICLSLVITFLYESTKAQSAAGSYKKGQ